MVQYRPKDKATGKGEHKQKCGEGSFTKKTIRIEKYNEIEGKTDGQIYRQTGQGSRQKTKLPMNYQSAPHTIDCGYPSIS